MYKPRLILLTNEGRPSGAVGQIDGYELMVQSGEVGSCNTISQKFRFDATTGNLSLILNLHIYMKHRGISV